LAIGALALAAAGVAGAVGLWVALASITGLIYHLLPGATFLVAAWVYRQVTGGRPAAWRELAVIIAAGAAGTIGGLVLVSGIGRELDPLPVTGSVVITGALIGVVWLRRGTPADGNHRGAEVRSS
jgi:hypothetical protein